MEEQPVETYYQYEYTRTATKESVLKQLELEDLSSLHLFLQDSKSLSSMYENWIRLI